MCDILSNQGMQIKTTLRFHLTPIGMTNIYKFYWREANYSWVLGCTTFILVLGRHKRWIFELEANLVCTVSSRPAWDTQWDTVLTKENQSANWDIHYGGVWFPQKAGDSSPMSSCYPSFGLSLKQSVPTRDICSSTFTAANPRCLGNSAASISIPNEQCRYTLKKHSAIKNNWITKFTAKRMDLEITILTEGQAQKDKQNVLFHTWWLAVNLWCLCV